MEAFLIGFCCALSWLPVIVGCWMIRTSFSLPLDLGNG